MEAEPYLIVTILVIRLPMGLANRIMDIKTIPLGLKIKLTNAINACSINGSTYEKD
jgi:hypothetical protein